MSELEIVKSGILEKDNLLSHVKLAEHIDRQPSSILSLVDRHRATMESIGGLIFFKKSSSAGSGYAREKREAFLNEAQATFLMTCLANSEIVILFKASLVSEYMRLKDVKPKTQLELAKEQVALLERLEEVNREKEYLQITLDLSKRWASVKLMERVLDDAFPWQPLKKYCVANDLEIKKVFDQNYGKVNSYPERAWKEVYGISPPD